MKVCPPCDQLLDVAQPPIAIAASKGLPVFSTPKHSTKSLRIAATTICLGLRRPRDFNRVTSATIAELYRMADRAGMESIGDCHVAQSSKRCSDQIPGSMSDCTSFIV